MSVRNCAFAMIKQREPGKYMEIMVLESGSGVQMLEYGLNDSGCLDNFIKELVSIYCFSLNPWTF